MLTGTFWAEQQKYTSPIFKRTMVKWIMVYPCCVILDIKTNEKDFLVLIGKDFQGIFLGSKKPGEKQHVCYESICVRIERIYT